MVRNARAMSQSTRTHSKATATAIESDAFKPVEECNFGYARTHNARHSIAEMS